MAPESSAPATGVALNTIEVRFTGGMLALNRLLTTLQNKRMPVASFAVGHNPDGMRATIVLDCPPEMAIRYTTLLSALEDVRDVGPTEGMEVALLKTGGDWRAASDRSGVGAHENGETVVVSGEAEKVESFLDSLGEDVEDIVRLGPVALPGEGGV